jgi:hypothetical protein
LFPTLSILKSMHTFVTHIWMARAAHHATAVLMFLEGNYVLFGCHDNVAVEAWGGSKQWRLEMIRQVTWIYRLFRKGGYVGWSSWWSGWTRGQVNQKGWAGNLHLLTGRLVLQLKQGVVNQKGQAGDLNV